MAKKGEVRIFGPRKFKPNKVSAQENHCVQLEIYSAPKYSTQSFLDDDHGDDGEGGDDGDGVGVDGPAVAHCAPV